MKPRVRQTLIWLSVGLNVAFAAGLAAVALFPNALAEPLGLQHGKPNKGGENVRPDNSGLRRGGGGSPDWFMVGTIKRLGDRLNLTPEQQAAIDEHADAIRSASRDAFREMNDQRKLMMQVILEHPEDEAKVQAVKVENRAAWDMFSDELFEGLRDIALILTPEQRAILAEEMSKPPEPREPREPREPKEPSEQKESSPQP